MITDFTHYHRDYYYKRRQKLIDYLGGQCVKCSSTEDLQFDHIDAAKKAIDIKQNLTLSTMREELDKCQLLCRKCHLEKTIAEKPAFQHGTQYAFMKKKCRCVECLQAWRKWHDRRNARRRQVVKSANTPLSKSGAFGLEGATPSLATTITTRFNT